ncbi:MAG: class I SAM-dependent methyltransferase [Lachnospiraceae bacterium]|nr:class I SAM-dependent methyltransferase [Lachnospiraceae bacterium]
MDRKELLEKCLAEESVAEMLGWDFSHIEGRYESEDEKLSWDYVKIVKNMLEPNAKILDIDTGGGEVLLSIGHPYELITATEGYEPNVEYCRKKLEPLGVRVEKVTDYAHLPFEDEEFDMVINRHGNYDADEVYRVLKKGGLFITQQVGDDNDKEFIEFLLPELPKKEKIHNLKTQEKVFQNAGFSVIEKGEALRMIKFFDIGAFVWFAKVISWEFEGFSVEKCIDKLVQAQKEIDKYGAIAATIHRYLIIARK